MKRTSYSFDELMMYRCDTQLMPLFVLRTLRVIITSVNEQFDKSVNQ
jgi:hypothetical protein